MTPITKLREAVEAGDDDQIRAAAEEVFGLDNLVLFHTALAPHMACEGAALRLIEAVLPEWFIDIEQTRTGWIAYLQLHPDAPPGLEEIVFAENPDLSLALIIALLKAMEAQNNE